MCHVYFFFFNDTATTEIYTLSLHDALPISPGHRVYRRDWSAGQAGRPASRSPSRRCASSSGRRRYETSTSQDRKSTRLNSSHANISYAVFCLKKKKQNIRKDLSSRFNL